jgi:TRAP-type C4-dicarboxylate transport system permease small subunit
MKILTRLYRLFDSAITLFGSLLIGIIAALIAVQVFARFFKNPFSWAEEISQFCLIISVFIGASIVERETGHIKVTTFSDMLPDRFGLILRHISSLILFLALCFTLLGSILLYPSINKLRSSAASIPIHWIYTCLNVGIVWWIVNTVRSAILQWKKNDPNE